MIIVTSKEKMIYSIFEPYFPSQANYPKLERKKLQNELSQMKPVSIVIFKTTLLKFFLSCNSRI